MTRHVVKICYPLFGAGGVVNPVNTNTGFGVFDGEAGTWRQKQSASFDGGWRWFKNYGQFVTIYNKNLHPRAYADITDAEFMDTCFDAEVVLKCAQIKTVIDHNAFTATEFVVDSLRALTDKVIQEITQ